MIARVAGKAIHAEAKAKGGRQEPSVQALATCTATGAILQIPTGITQSSEGYLLVAEDGLPPRTVDASRSSIPSEIGGRWSPASRQVLAMSAPERTVRSVHALTHALATHQRTFAIHNSYGLSRQSAKTISSRGEASIHNKNGC